MKRVKYLKLLAIALVGFLFGCRGQTMETTPVHVVWNMDEQRRFGPFEKNEFFADNRAMRRPVKGTIHRGGLENNSELYQGITEDSSWVKEIPIEVTERVLKRGQVKYNIFCTPCHGITGEGNGVIITGGYGFVPPPSYHSKRLRNMPPGQIYSAITNGVRTMFSYANQIPVKDRWAIVAYIQALQKSRHVTKKELDKYNVTVSEIKKMSEDDELNIQQGPSGGVVSAQLGKQLIMDYGCTSCHSTDGSQLYAPTFKGLYGSMVVLSDGSVVRADKGYLVESMQYPAAKIVRGYRVEMPSYRDLMTDAQMYSIVAYLKTLSTKGQKEMNGSTAAQKTAKSDTTQAAVSNAATADTTNSGNADTTGTE